MAGDAFRVNGNVLSWGSLKFKAGGALYVGFNSISFGDKLEMAILYGMGVHQAPRGRSRGKYSVDPIKVGGPPSSLQLLREQLAALSISGTSYGSVEFEGTLQFVERDETPITVEFNRCRWAANASNHEENPDPLKEEFELSCMAIRRNGLVLFDDSEGSPV